MPPVASWSRDQYWMVHRIALRLAVDEYVTLRQLGYSAAQAEEHAQFILTDTKRIARCTRQ